MAVVTTPNDYIITVGDRVQLAPHTDAWMQGDRFGTVTSIGTKRVTVRTDSGRTRRFPIRKVELNIPFTDFLLGFTPGY